MNCTTHILGFDWKHHTWRRRVASTETISTRASSMWGRDVAEQHVRCLTEEVCTTCGAVRDTGACFCDLAKANVCGVRLACLEDASRSNP
jgi:hypothetical protein